MKYLLLLVNAEGAGAVSELAVRECREFAGDEGVSVHFRPVRNDALFHSAKVGSGVAYRVLLGEGCVRAQLWVEYEVHGPPVSVAGRSGDLLFALALLTSRINRSAGEYPIIAATGVLDADEAAVGPESVPAVISVERIEAKVAAAVGALAQEREAVILYPSADQERVEAWCAAAPVPPHIHLQPVATLDDALGVLGIQLQRVYLGNPYRGLEYFDYAHHAVFFGRDREVAQLTAQLLRREAIGAPGVLVEGASGSGKSSFLRAGILPALVIPTSRLPELDGALGDRPVPQSVSRAIWHPALMPANADERTAVRSIQRIWQTLPELAGDCLEGVDTFEALFRRWRAFWPRERRFVWLADQLEELFGLGLDETTVKSFGLFLLALQLEGAWTLACIRADVTPQLKRHASLRAVFDSNEGQYYLPGLGPTALDEVICRPARAAGLTFGVNSSGQRLDRALREEAYRDYENALPLLQLTLHELYCRRAGRELPYAAYEALGGLSGAVAALASAALENAPRSTLDTLSRLFRALVTVDQSGQPLRRYALRTEIAEVPAQEQLLVALVNARLCVTGQRDGQAVIALAHEAVLRTWPALARWLKEESRLLQLRELAEHDTRLWQQHARSDSWLAPASRLGVLVPLESAGVRLGEPVRDFMRRSRKRVRRTATLKHAGVAAALLLAIGATAAALIAVSKQRDAQYQATRALRAKEQAAIEANTARATADFLSTIFNAPTPERALGRPITARELLDAGARRLRTSLNAAPEIRARLTEQIGNAYREIGEYNRAVPLLKSGVEQYRALPRAPLSDRAQAYAALGQLYLATGQWTRATRVLRRAMILERQVPAARRSAMPNIVYAHIEIHEAHDRAAQVALDQAREILRNRRHAPDEQNYRLLLGYSRLYLDQGKLSRAKRFGLEALALQLRIMGPDDPSAIEAAFRLGDVYSASDDAVMAAKYDRRATFLARKIYGENNPVYAQMLGAYATDLHYVGHNKAAERLLRQVLRIRLRTLGPRHRLTGQAYLNLGSTLTFEGRWREGLALTRRAVKIFESSEGRDSMDTAFAITAEARILTHLGRPTEAIPLVLHALRVSRRPSRSDRVDSVWEWLQLGRAYAALGRFPDSADAVDHAIEVYGRVYGNTGEPLASLLDVYATDLEAEGRTSAAKAALARAASVRARSGSTSAPTLDLEAN